MSLSIIILAMAHSGMICGGWIWLNLMNLILLNFLHLSMRYYPTFEYFVCKYKSYHFTYRVVLGKCPIGIMIYHIHIRFTIFIYFGIYLIRIKFIRFVVPNFLGPIPNLEKRAGNDLGNYRISVFLKKNYPMFSRKLFKSWSSGINSLTFR